MDRIVFRLGPMLPWAAFAAAVIPNPVAAQQSALPRLDPIDRAIVDEDRGITLDVRRRVRDEFNPMGMRIGMIQVYPSVAVGSGYDTNLFADPDRRNSAALLQLEPSFLAISTFARGEIRLDAGARLTRFVDDSEANESSYRIGAAGSYEIGKVTKIEAGAERQRLVERRDSSSRPDGVLSPITFNQTQAYGRLRRDSGKLRGLVNIDYTVFDFNSVKALSPSGAVVAIINQDARDQSSLRGSMRAEYSVLSGLALFAELTGTDISYRLDRSAAGIANLDGSNVTALAGVVFGTGRLIQGSAGVGYVRRAFRAREYRAIRGVAANVDLRYFVTPLVTVALVASRTVEEAVLQRSTGFVSNAIEIRADYELLRSLILNIRGADRRNEFRDSARIDSIAEVGGGARYTANRHLRFEADGTYVRRTVKNDLFSPSYNDARVVVSTRYSF